MSLAWVQDWTHGWRGMLLGYVLLVAAFRWGLYRYRVPWQSEYRWGLILVLIPVLVAALSVSGLRPTLYGWGVRPQGAFEYYLVMLLATTLSYWSGAVWGRLGKPPPGPKIVDRSSGIQRPPEPAPIPQRPKPVVRPQVTQADATPAATKPQVVPTVSEPVKAPTAPPPEADIWAEPIRDEMPVLRRPLPPEEPPKSKRKEPQ